MDELLEVRRGAQDRQVPESLGEVLRLIVDESNELDAVLGMLEELARHAVAHVPPAHHDRVLAVAAIAPAKRARGRPAGSDQNGGSTPERCKFPDVRIGYTRQGQGEEQDPREQRDEVEDG